ncbi:hypothetical protein [Fimbriiglobus ruber]|uniref:hypothetical protein n=1 Tax=Fimbriiglobus ruber TaxID=1908690 RepID=UPI000B4BC9B7|nr:hypothetical protein [Fimbriiglobus ruber]
MTDVILIDQWNLFHSSYRRALAGMKSLHPEHAEEYGHLQELFKETAERCGFPYREIPLENGEKLA